MERGYKLEELYNMTLKELRNSLKSINKGLSYKIYKQALLINQAIAGKLPRTHEEANPELFPRKKSYVMPDWIKERYYRQKGVEYHGQ
jgi:hypothetical protein